MTRFSAHRRHLFSLLTAIGLFTSLSYAQQPSRAAEDAPGADGEESRRERRANMTPEEMRKRMSAALKEQFKVESDEEWALISERLLKVQELRRASGGGGGGGFMGRPFGGPPGGDNANAARARAGAFGGPASSPEVEALSTAIRSNATSADLKARLERLREVRKQNEAKLAAAQEELRAVLDVRQESIAVLMGLLP